MRLLGVIAFAGIECVYLVAQVTPAISELIARLHSGNSTIVRDAAYNLASSPGSSAAVAALIQVAGHPDPAVREVVVYALGRIGSPDQATIEALTHALGDHNLKVQRAAAEALGRISPLPRFVLLALGDVLAHGNADLQRAAAFTLAGAGADAQPLAPALAELLRSPNSEVRRVAAYALGCIGYGARTALPDLQDLLRHDDKPEVREVASFALGRMGAAAQRATPDLRAALKDSDANVRRVAAEALETIAPAGQSATPALLDALHDRRPAVRQSAADALGRMHLAGRPALPALEKALNDDDLQVRRAAANAIAAIATALQDGTDAKVASDVTSALNAIKTAASRTPDTVLNDAGAQVDDALSKIKAGRGWRDWMRRALLESKPGIIGITVAAAYLTWFVILRFLVLRYSPLHVLAWNDALESYAEFTLPEWLGRAKLPVRHVLLIGRYWYHTRVLDAWVSKHVDAVDRSFRQRDTYRARATFVPLPVLLNGKTVPSLTAADLRETCSRNRWYIHIQGEGGAGKTTLACQLALWSMAESPPARIREDRRMLPVLLEPGLDFDIQKDIESLKRAARGQLQLAVGTVEPIREELFERLLRTCRVLVILDGFSEMTYDAQAPGESRARLGHPDFPVNALVVTSRANPLAGDQPDVRIQPLRIDSNHLLPFMNAYLSNAGATLADRELYEACRRLAEVVGSNRGITPLLARLYAEEIVTASHNGAGLGGLSGSVPDLMLGYLNTLNRNRRNSDPDNPTVHSAVKLAAWECIKRTFRPGRARKSDLVAAFKRERLDPQILAYLETRLGLISTVAPAETEAHFVLDPVAEYLAALQLVEANGTNKKKWNEFLQTADSMPGAPTAIRGFMVAVNDCCAAKGPEFGLRSFLLEELGRRAN
jgi:HEAT repeat protein